MCTDLIVKIAKLLPRGAYRLLVHLSKLIPGLRRYPVMLPIGRGGYLASQSCQQRIFPAAKEWLLHASSNGGLYYTNLSKRR